MTAGDRVPNFAPRTEYAGPYELQFYAEGVVRMGNGSDEPAMTVFIYRDGAFITSCRLNSTTLCLPGYSIGGVEATATEIVLAVLGNEDIFTGERSFPAEDLEGVQP